MPDTGDADFKQRCDTGKVVAIRCVYTNVDAELLNGYNPIQVNASILYLRCLPITQSNNLFSQLFSLHEYGLLTLWTLIEASTLPVDDIKTNRIDHQSSWSQIKLTQSRCIDLRMSIETFVRKKIRKRPVSGFKKTQSYFESDIFNDAVLKELQEANSNGDNKILSRFTCVTMEVSMESIFIATNENFLLHARKSLRSNLFRKIQIDDDPRNRRYATTLLTIPNGDGDEILLAGLSDGTVKSYRIRHTIDGHSDLVSEDDESCLSLPSTALPSPHSSRANPMGSGGGELAASSTSNAPSMDLLSVDQLLGKSCTIQNIVTGERPVNEPLTLNFVDGVVDDALHAIKGDDSRSNLFARNLLNDETILNGLTLHSDESHAVRKLICSDGQKRIVFVLRGMTVSAYSLVDHTEAVCATSKKDRLDVYGVLRRRRDAAFAIELDEGRIVADIAMVSTAQKDEFLVRITACDHCLYFLYNTYSNHR